ncbi:mucoidy inhibitor MuiA family protein [Kaistia terrae]|uniref:Mucoidy inhibitor MuiA family protein n=1 Tax=Kaistia terrae TaxID=537017 RepID=A0ABW0PS39_9HYPH|nr:mucoidy inhibitor MuiA family protein [Kaistia terrae]MCX5580180.1 mucoidy inhibitor MuiA family protein [Kaistia terrae]
MKILALTLAALAASGAHAFAADLPLSSRITSVTVHPQGAAVLREAAFSVPPGVSVLVADDLPADMVADSLRVDGLAVGGVTIRSVETRPGKVDPEADPIRQAIAAEIETLRDKIGSLDDRLAALDLRVKFIDQLAESVPQGLAKGIAEGKSIGDWVQTAEGLGLEREKIDQQRSATRIERRGVEKRIDERQRALDALPPVLPKLMARIELMANQAATGNLSLGYRTYSAGWSPAYDISLALGEAADEPKMELIRRAELHQETGEDWAGVALSLSTTRPAEGTQAPDLSESVVRFAPRFAQDEASESMQLARPAPAPTARYKMEAEVGGGADAVVQSEAVADFGDFRAEYRIAEPVSVASGEGSRSVRIASEAVAPAIEVRAVPAVSDSAFLTARFKNKSGAPYVGGNAVLYRDGAFAGTVPLAFTAPEAELTLGFGIDDKVGVTRTTLDRKTGERGLISSEKTDELRYRIKVENRHARPISIVVLDQLPVPEAKTITVQSLAEATPPTESAVDGKRGVVAWRYDYAAGETKEIIHAFAIRWPADQDVFWEN